MRCGLGLMAAGMHWVRPCRADTGSTRLASPGRWPAPDIGPPRWGWMARAQVRAKRPTFSTARGRPGQSRPEGADIMSSRSQRARETTRMCLTEPGENDPVGIILCSGNPAPGDRGNEARARYYHLPDAPADPQLRPSMPCRTVSSICPNHESEHCVNSDARVTSEWHCWLAQQCIHPLQSTVRRILMPSLFGWPLRWRSNPNHNGRPLPTPTRGPTAPIHCWASQQCHPTLTASREGTCHPPGCGDIGCHRVRRGISGSGAVIKAPGPPGKQRACERSASPA
jgi:hypothetical protein